MLSEQQEVWKAHVSLLCRKETLINSSLALMSVCLKAFTVDPGLVANRSL